MAPIIAYASRTGTRRNLDALRARGWRLLVSATGVLRAEGFPYALDNGAWTSFQKGTPFDETRFALALAKMGPGADWVCSPDIVAGGGLSLCLSLSWLERCLDRCARVLIPVQDGMTADELRPHLAPHGGRVGIFIGGSPDSNWKEETASEWAQLCREFGAWCHMGRVNSQRRISICATAGVTSFDGTSATKYAVELPKLHRAVVQQSFILETKKP